MTEDIEHWVPVPGYPLYSVSDRGQVRSTDYRSPNAWARTGTAAHRGRLLKRYLGRGGYYMVGLYNGEQRGPRGFYVHRLMALTFFGEPEPGAVVRHLDGDPLNNRLSNLAYGTVSDNALDDVRNGVHPEARKTHCPRGHEYDSENTYVNPSGHRKCRACRKLTYDIANARMRERRRSASDARRQASQAIRRAS